jgi:hypothetical protein
MRTGTPSARRTVAWAGKQVDPLDCFGEDVGEAPGVVFPAIGGGEVVVAFRVVFDFPAVVVPTAAVVPFLDGAGVVAAAPPVTGSGFDPPTQSAFGSGALPGAGTSNPEGQAMGIGFGEDMSSPKAQRGQEGPAGSMSAEHAPFWAVVLGGTAAPSLTRTTNVGVAMMARTQQPPGRHQTRCGPPTAMAQQSAGQAAPTAHARHVAAMSAIFWASAGAHAG